MARKQPHKLEKTESADGTVVPIGDPVQLGEVADRLARQPVVAFDTEFLREKTYYPKLGLIQVADRERSWLLDPLALSVEDRLAETVSAWAMGRQAGQNEGRLTMLAGPALDEAAIAASLLLAATMQVTL